MSLRQKTLVIIGLTVSTVICLIGALSSTIFLQDYVELEEGFARENVDRLRQAIDRDAGMIAVGVADWAAWDDTHRFVQDHNEAFIEANINETILDNLDVDMILFVDAVGEIVLARWRNDAGEMVDVIPDDVFAAIRDGSRILEHVDLESSSQGILVTPSQTLLLAAKPILTSNAEGPVVGTLIFSRHFADECVAELSELTRVQFEATKVETALQSPDESLVRNMIDGDDVIVVRPADGHVIHACALIRDVDDRPAILLRTMSPRTIYQQGQATLHRFHLLAAGIGCVLAVVTLVIVQSTILKPLMRLIEGVRSVRDSGDDTIRMEADGSDEVAELARAINGMIESLSGYRQQLVTQQEALLTTNQQLQDMAGAARSASETKSRFLANMSHEIRTPMTAILGFSEMLAEAGQNEEQRLDAAETIRRNGRYLLQIINDILDISKIEAGAMSIEQIVCRPDDLIEKIASDIRLQADAKHIGFAIEYASEIPGRIVSDPTRLKQILTNLLSNAVKFTESGGVRLIVGLQPDRSPQRMQFDVIDTGIGMTPEQVDRVFQPFSQADVSTTRVYGGTGLGLVICRSLAEMLGGEVSLVSSKHGEGSHFRVTIATSPAEGGKSTAAQAPPQQAAQNPIQSSWTQPLAERVVLLVEDSPDNQRLLTHILTKAGAQVELAGNGRQAVDKAMAARRHGRPFDAVLMDMQMPVLDGYDATRQLRRMGYDRPIIALTANAMSCDRDTCLQAGCDDYLSKPVDREELIDAILRHGQVRVAVAR